MNNKLYKFFLWLTFPFMILALYGAFIYAPRAKWPGAHGVILGEIQRIFYFHVPLAWVMMIAFAVTFVYSILYLAKSNINYDIIASSSAEIGIVFATLAILTGSMWAKPAWGTYWTWDPRLTTMLLLWFIFVGYFILRGFVEEDEKRARLSAIIAIIGFLDVPLVFISVRLWRSLHPVVIESSKKGFAIAPKMLHALLFSLLTFTILYAVMLHIRVHLGKVELKIKMMKRKLNEEF